MAKALKLVFDTPWLEKISAVLQSHLTEFDIQAFQQSILVTEWPDMALKQRIRHVAIVLTHVLPSCYEEALPILEKVAQEFTDLPHLVFTDFIELQGMHSPQRSLAALARLTEGCSAEFAVRPYIEQNQEEVLGLMLTWTSDQNEHIRRLASEGCRPRLPWANALVELKRNPEPIRPILEALKTDQSAYVRKSVANNINDISKDHPLWVLQLCQQWKGQNPLTDWIIKHGLRSLLKQGNAQALFLLDYSQPDRVIVEAFKVAPSVLIGQKHYFSAEIDFADFLGGKVRLEYAITFLRKQAKPYRKVFKIGESVPIDRIKKISKAHDFKKISTRKYYPGEHVLEILVNGHSLAKQTFLVREDESN